MKLVAASEKKLLKSVPGYLKLESYSLREVFVPNISSAKRVYLLALS